MFIGYNETLRSWPIAGSRPEERIRPVAVVVEAHNQEGVLIDRVHIAGHLVVVGIEFTQILPPIWTILLLALGHWGCDKKRKTRTDESAAAGEAKSQNERL